MAGRGRGGAGNIEAANRRFSEDLEANQTAAETGKDTSPIAQALQDEKLEQSVAYSGRGGAGNTYSPAMLSEKGQFASSSSSAAPTRTTASQGTPAVRMQGRGGAGNFAPSESSRATEPSDDTDREALRARAEQDVEAGLARPDQVYLGPKEKQKHTPTDDPGISALLQS